MKIPYFLILCTTLLVFCCDKASDDTPPEVNLPEISVSDGLGIESTGQSSIRFEVRVNSAIEETISFDFRVEGITATPDEDFSAAPGSAEIEAGATSVTVNITVLDDEINEIEEQVKLILENPTNATLQRAEAIGAIKDNDDPNAFDDKGYYTPDSYYGYQLAWEEEFDGTELNPEVYNFELGNGCPDLCGWGNQELQVYTNLEKNIKVADGLLRMTATAESPNSYESARIQTKGKKEFQFGRIDIRAKLPTGQGIWPAIWMLGNNIDEVGWPACGEIDIMELVGHQPNIAYGTAHWGPQGRGYSTYLTGGHSLYNEDFIDQFHVFSIVWEFNKIVWYVDETKFHTITPNDMQGEQYRFNQPFFFIFNIAVGGQWPGPPDATTVFPQTMEIDYIRVFQ